MPPPLPLPSKAVLRAIRGLALGTSCAIGVIVEDRRRRISTLHTAVANKQKLKASRQYHQRSLEEQAEQPYNATDPSVNLEQHERDERELREHYALETAHHTTFDSPALANKDTPVSFQVAHGPKPVQIPKHPPSQPSLAQPTTSQYSPFVTKRQLKGSPASLSPTNHSTMETTRPRETNMPAAKQESHEDLVLSIENLLASTDEEKLDQAVSLFLLNSIAVSSGPHLDKWLEISVRLAKECQAAHRWENASRILTTVIKFGPMDEAQYFAYNPLPIIEFHLCPQYSHMPCSTTSLNSAAKIFLADFKEKNQGLGTDMEAVGRTLLLKILSSQRFNLSHPVYWRILRWAKNHEESVCWAIDIFFQHHDHKSVVKFFLLHFSRMQHPLRRFNQTMDHVMGSIEALKGLKAMSILEAFARMECPSNQKLRTRWVMTLLRVYSTRFEDMAPTIEFFEKVVSLGLLDKVSHPQGIYLAIVEIAAKAGDRDMAYSYAEKVTYHYPESKHDAALKLAVLKAKVGDWDGVLQTFGQVRPDELAEAASYGGAFISALQVFADSHSASETQDFAMQFIRDTGYGFSPLLVTLVAKKYGEARDMKGFIGWLKLCSREGFALDAGFCNSVLHNCSTAWNVSFSGLRMLHSKFKAMSPNCSDEVTKRILSQAAQRDGMSFKLINRTGSRVIAINKLAYSGRSTNTRDIYEAMNQEFMNKKYMSAVKIYKRATRYSMPFNSHCLRLVVLATLRGKGPGSGAGSALSMIQDAHAEGHEVGPAVSTFIKCEIDAFSGSPEDVVMHMRNLISRFESSQIVIGTGVLTHMAEVCAKINQPEKAIAMCNLAQNRSGAPHLCFSRQSFKALATAYSQLLDVGGMSSLIHNMFKSEFSIDKMLLSHLKSILRIVERGDRCHAREALVEVITRGIEQMIQARAKVHTEGKLISQETLRIVGNALADLQKSKAKKLKKKKDQKPVTSAEGP
ncbi:hypothetical protein F4825DRAFT_21676 [Nemania diffusa]|nr:hypothetical protein F4825DRAFT_21676 [Nemania diffusa]